MGYRNFELAIYFDVHDVNQITDLECFEMDFSEIEKHLKIGKIYLETYRADEWAKREHISQLKEFFERKGIRVVGGITTAFSTAYITWEDWKLFCYSSPENLQKLEEVVRYTAILFNEIIFDDFYFTNCRCENCTHYKENKTWSEFRTKLLANVSLNYIVGPAKDVNPEVKLVIKFPNWYEHYQETGYNLEDEARIFDGIFTGVETRDSNYTQQNLPRYLSYFLPRYMDHVLPRGNGGGWFDSYDCYNPLHFAEQAYLTLFGKVREVILYRYGSIQDTMAVPIAGYALKRTDSIMDFLGTPVGISCYKPFHSSGEDFLHNYLGMIGIPLEPYPNYPDNSKSILLTASASKDPDIIHKIKTSLEKGKSITVTSGFIQKTGTDFTHEFGNIRISNRKINVQKFACKTRICAFKEYYNSHRPILFSVLEIPTNDVWPYVIGLTDEANTPILMSINYGKGNLNIINVPDDFSDIYDLPPGILNCIRSELLNDFLVRIEGESKVGLFLFDNRVLIIESFLPRISIIRLIISGVDDICNLSTGKSIHGPSGVFELELEPGNYQIFSY
jgi:hypothetical protein